MKNSNLLTADLNIPSGTLWHHWNNYRSHRGLGPITMGKASSAVMKDFSTWVVERLKLTKEERRQSDRLAGITPHYRTFLRGLSLEQTDEVMQRATREAKLSDRPLKPQLIRRHAADVKGLKLPKKPSRRGRYLAAKARERMDSLVGAVEGVSISLATVNIGLAMESANYEELKNWSQVIERSTTKLNGFRSLLNERIRDGDE